MQKRKFSLQNFEGGRALSREEMKNVLGGMAAAPAGGGTNYSCTLTTTSGGTTYSLPTTQSGTANSCAQADAAAESCCNDFISTTGNGVTNCHYTCIVNGSQC